jgi:hypothetical protein
MRDFGNGLLSGVAGMSMWRMPYSDGASSGFRN